MQRSSYTRRWLLASGQLAFGMVSLAGAQEPTAPAVQPPATTPPKLVVPVNPTAEKPKVVIQMVKPNQPSTGTAGASQTLPTPRVESSTTTTSKTSTVTVIVQRGGEKNALGCDCSEKGPRELTEAETRQQAALIIDSLSPIEAPRYGRNAPVPPINCEVPAAEAYAEGLRALKKFDSARALALFNHALSIDPTHPATLQLKAVALYDLGRDHEAAQAARQGKILAREQPGGLEELSRALEPIQGHRRGFLDMAALYNLTGENADCCPTGATGPGGVIQGPPVTKENPLKPGVVVDEPGKIVPVPRAPETGAPPVAPQPPVNTDTPKPTVPRTVLPNTKPATNPPAKPATPPAKPEDANGPKL